MKRIFKDKRIIVIIIGLVLGIILSTMFVYRNYQTQKYRNTISKINTDLKKIEEKYKKGDTVINRQSIVRSSDEDQIATTYTSIINDYSIVLNESMKTNANNSLISLDAYNDKNVSPSINKYVYTHTGDFYYGYLDIDHNGVNECIIGYKGANDTDITPIEIYGYNERAKFITNRDLLNVNVDIKSMAITDEGYISIYGENGDEAAYLKVGHIDSDGFTFKVDQDVKASLDGSEGTITAENMKSLKDQYSKQATINWNKLNKPKSSTDWNKAYKEIIECFKRDEDYHYELIYTTKNGLPSLLVSNNSFAQERLTKSFLFTYTINGLKKIEFRVDKLSYVDKVGTFRLSKRVENKTQDSFYEFTDDGANLKVTSTRYTKWDNKKVSKKDYQNNSNELLGKTKDTELINIKSEQLMSYSDILDTIKQL